MSKANTNTSRRAQRQDTQTQALVAIVNELARIRAALEYVALNAYPQPPADEDAEE